MKIQLDLKSAVIGFAFALLFTTIISFKNSTDAPDGRYQTAIAENKIIILDTRTGAYIMQTYISSKLTWIRGNFESTRMDGTETKKD
ncbi:hypothetical protein [Desertivirga arenae]|uniref:hypothetical protein n=1 Tax=Desertivirga arenae TaxID=2810309 RepID=UPI001A96C3F8|nr:hypothetical protein [Pedobacter sp. SYSU D00823]